ncbi:MAG: PA2778 family cysteine peptidase [Wenzhouxiangellaceae bacterium]|nr:PA2778 family cysteine peptidase [Wenzhouxiangellaceae bacterium]
MKLKPASVRAATMAALALWLAGCAGLPAHMPESLPARVELDDTPFHPQLKHHCGPAALTTVLGASGASPSYDEVVGQVYVPDLEGSLQVELMAAARGFGRIPFRIPGRLDAVLREVGAGRPVLILQNLGARSLPAWHYAVVVGYDRERRRIVMRSGAERRKAVPAGRWLRQWDRAGRWAIVVAEPGELPATADRSAVMRALANFDEQAPPDARLRAWRAAARRWPEAPLAWVGRGNAAYALGDLETAATDFGRALELRPDYWPARLNLARVWFELGDACRARRVLEAQRMEFDHPLIEPHGNLSVKLEEGCPKPKS